MKSSYKQIRIDDFSYELPDEKIAKYPLAKRDESKLLYYNQSIKGFQFHQLPDILQSNDLLIFNNAKVIQARLEFKSRTGARIEIFCLEPHEPSDYSLAFQANSVCKWKCLIGNSKKWKDEILEKQVEIKNQKYLLKAEKWLQIDSYHIENHNDIIIQFRWSKMEDLGEEPVTFGEILEIAGVVPLPPYIKRKAESEDKIRYQTIYAHREGSVAAPTAGLHFTDSVFTALSDKGIGTVNLTLHVGAGTFRPVKSKTIGEHEMHEEHFEISKHAIEKILNQNGRIIAVGTTSARTLESLCRMGAKLIKNEPDPFKVSQWEVYERPDNYEMKKCLSAISNYLDDNKLKTLYASTGIIILPSYRFRMVNGLITNFHQPMSTLLLLIAAFVGDKWREIYDFALANNYRFLSYGDCSFLTV